MSKVVIDIETVGFDFDSYDQKSQEYLLKYAQNEEERMDMKNRLAFYPLTGEVVTIGMLNPDTGRGIVFFQDKGTGIGKFEKEGIVYEAGNEKEILEKFWDLVKTYKQVVTFNGRTFDLPFLMLRSAINKVRTSRNFMSYRYDAREHCDLLDQLTFYGASRRFSLDFYAKSFGIKSSKEDGIDGSMVGGLYKEQRYLDVAFYCVRDLRTTKELYDYWNRYLRF
ncbi:MAG: ribonuclease H-like domain-containing protein [Parcubacteria group bacterium]